MDDYAGEYKHKVVAKLRWFAESFVGGKPATDIAAYLRYYDALLQRPVQERRLPDACFEAFQALLSTNVENSAEIAYEYVRSHPSVAAQNPTENNVWAMFDVLRAGLAQQLIEPDHLQEVRDFLSPRQRTKNGAIVRRAFDLTPQTWYDAVGSSSHVMYEQLLFGNSNIGNYAYTNMQVAGQLAYDGRAYLSAMRADLYPTLTDEDRAHFKTTTVSLVVGGRLHPPRLLLDVIKRGAPLAFGIEPRIDVGVVLSGLPTPWPWASSTHARPNKALYVLLDGWSAKGCY